MEAVSLSLNQISALEKVVKLVSVTTLVHPSADFTVRVLVALPLCLKDRPIKRLADEDVDVANTLFPIPISKEFAVGIFVLMFCLILNETHPLVLAVMVFVGENANITCDPPVVVVFRYWATFPPSLVILV